MVGYDEAVSDVSGPPSPQANQKRSSPGAGAGLGGALASFTRGIVRVTAKIFGGVRDRGGKSLADFRARPEHSRWRAYTLGCYGLLVAGTLAAQFWTENPLGIYVKVQQVDIPKSTYIFVRNDSDHRWASVRLRLNGVYEYNRIEVLPGDNLRLEPQQFTVMDSVSGRQNKFPKNASLEIISIDCDRGHYETRLKP